MNQAEKELLDYLHEHFVPCEYSSESGDLTDKVTKLIHAVYQSGMHDAAATKVELEGYSNRTIVSIGVRAKTEAILTAANKPL